MMKRDKKYVSMLMDLTLLFFLTLVTVTVIFMGLGTNNFFSDFINLLITLILVVITFFTGIVSGLIFTLIFIFAQLGFVTYQYVFFEQFSYGSLFWLIVPPLYCLSIYLITYQIRILEKENEQLRQDSAQLNALDAKTHLRTLSLYEGDFPIFAELSRRFDTDLYAVVIRIRYWDSLKKLMSNEQQQELLELVTSVFQASADEYSSLYLVDQITPTWSSFVFSNNEALKVFRELLKERFLEELGKSAALNNLTIDLLVAQAKYDEAEMHSGADLLSEGVNGLQYDV